MIMIVLIVILCQLIITAVCWSNECLTVDLATRASRAEPSWAVVSVSRRCADRPVTDERLRTGTSRWHW